MSMGVEYSTEPNKTSGGRYLQYTHICIFKLQTKKTRKRSSLQFFSHYVHIFYLDNIISYERSNILFMFAVLINVYSLTAD